MKSIKKNFGQLFYAAEQVKKQADEIQTITSKTEKARTILGLQTISDILWESVLVSDELEEHEAEEIEALLDKVISILKQ